MATTTASKTAAPKAAPKTAPKAEPVKKETTQQLKNRLRNEAEREVLNSHRDEVVRITQAKYDEHGLEYVRRLTDAEKAEAKVQEYFKQFPELRDQFADEAVKALAAKQLNLAVEREQAREAAAAEEFGPSEVEAGEPEWDVVPDEG